MPRLDWITREADESNGGASRELPVAEPVHPLVDSLNPAHRLSS
jgi:hypothetical protein